MVYAIATYVKAQTEFREREEKYGKIFKLCIIVFLRIGYKGKM